MCFIYLKVHPELDVIVALILVSWNPCLDRDCILFGTVYACGFPAGIFRRNDVVLTLMRCNYAALTSVRYHYVVMGPVNLLDCTELFGSSAELQWLEHLWDHENMFETGIVRAK